MEVVTLAFSTNVKLLMQLPTPFCHMLQAVRNYHLLGTSYFKDNTLNVKICGPSSPLAEKEGAL